MENIESVGLFNINIDFDKSKEYNRTNICYKEFDTNTAKIEARLLKSKVAIDLTGTTVNIKMITSFGETITESATVKDTVNGIIDFTFPQNALKEGVNFFEVILSKDGMIKESPRMSYKVLDSIEDTGIETESNYPILLTLITDTQNVVNSASALEQTVSSNETIRVADENIRKSNETTRQSNETTRQSQETARQQSMTSIQNQFNALAPTSSTNAEVQLARTDVNGKTYASLQERLLADNKQQNIMYSSVEGTYITSDSVDGWLKDIQIVGNTYQNPSVLSDIRSTGTKIGDGRYEIPLLCVSKNLFSGEFTTPQYIRIDVGYEGEFTTGTSNNRTTKKIPCKPNTKYVVSGGDRCAWRFEDYYGNKVGWANASSITTPSNCRYMYVYYSSTGLHTNVQIEENTVATTYEIPQSHKLTILSDYQIEKVGTVADRILQLSDGKWNTEKNIIDTIFNGSGTWIDTTAFDETSGTGNYMVFKNTSFIMTNYICNRFKRFDTHETFKAIDSEGIFVASWGTIIKILKSKLGTQDATGFKTWLSQNNVLVKYATTTPVYYPLADDQQVALKTFATKTNILSLCEIEPTIKASVPKSTSASINSITEKVSNLSNDLSRVKKLEDATTSTCISDNGFVNITDSTNGYLSDLKLEGRTLVNRFDKSKLSFTLSGGCTQTSTTDYYEVTKVTNAPKGAFTLKSNTILLPNTKYTVIVNRYSANDEICIYDTLKDSFITNYTKSNVITFTTPSDVSDIRLYFTNNTDSVMRVYKSVLVLEGDYISNPPNYIEGIKSVGQDVDKLVVSSVNASGNLLNLLNLTFDSPSKLINKDTNSLGYKVASEGAYGMTYAKLNLDIGQPYYFSSSIKYNISTTAGANIREKNSDGSGATFIVGNNGTFTPKQGKIYELVLQGNGTASVGINVDCVFYNLCLNKGTAPITYRPIETDKKQILFLDTADSTWKKPTLRGIWSNGALVVGDTIEKHADGKYYYHKRMSVVTFTGSESWVTATGTTNCNQFQLETGLTGGKPVTLMLSDKYIQNNSTTDDNEGISASASVGSRIYVRVLKTKAADLAAFKTYLSTNNFTVVYQLQTELVYECTPLDLSSYDSETNYLVESGVLCPRSTVKCMNFIGSVVNNLKEQMSVLQNKVYDDNMLMKATLINHEARMVAKGI